MGGFQANENPNPFLFFETSSAIIIECALPKR